MQATDARTGAQAPPFNEALARLLLATILVFAFALRWDGIGEESLSHPEAYIPGAPLSPETTTPPPRHGFLENLSWHFHHEPHPVLYYMGMFAWTSAFGESETALRTPSVLFGIGSIALVYALGAGLYGRAAGLWAAALLAFNGFHIFWSGMARMYAPGAFFSLLATLVLVRLASSAKASLPLRLGYVASLAAAVHTTELNWGVFAAHVAWTAFLAGGREDARKPATLIAWLQVAAFAFAAPALLHALYTARDEAAPPPSLEFLAHYFAFGFALEPDHFSDPPRMVALPIVVLAAVLSTTLAAIGAAARPRLAVQSEPSPGFAIWIAACAALSALLLALLTSIAESRRAALAVAVPLPIAALVWPALLNVARPALERLAAPARRVDPFTFLLLLLGALTPLAFVAASIWKPVTAFRSFIVFIPFLLILAGAGLAALSGRRAAWAGAAAAVAAFLAVSVWREMRRPKTPVDYKGLAAAMRAELRPDDLVFIRPQNWRDAPVTYYLPHDQIVGGRFAERLAGGDRRRVWTLHWADDNRLKADAKIAAALAGFVQCEEARARRALAVLNVRSDAAKGCRTGSLAPATTMDDQVLEDRSDRTDARSE